jgi:hypothetical protein
MGEARAVEQATLGDEKRWRSARSPCETNNTNNLEVCVMEIGTIRKTALALLLLAMVGPAVARDSRELREDGISPREALNLLPAGTGFFSMKLVEGDPGYAWVKTLAGRHVLATQVTLSVEYPAQEIGLAGAAQLQEAILHEQDHAAARNKTGYAVPDGPTPDGPGRTIGQSADTKTFCASVRIGTTVQMGDVEYEWEWQYTTDSNGDGKKDSNPDWVCVGIKVKFLYVDAQLC